MVQFDPIPQDNGTDAQYAERLVPMTYTELLVELKENSLQLLTRLELEGRPAREYATFTFQPGNHILHLPEPLATDIGIILPNEVSIRTDTDYTAKQAALSVSINGNLITGKNVDVTIFVNEGIVTTAYDIDNSEHELPPITECTVADINRMIASIILPNELGDYAFFDTLNLTDSEVMHNVAESLERHSDSTEREGVYTREGQHVAYQKVDGLVIAIEFESELADSTLVNINTLQSDITPEISSLNDYPIDGVEVGEQAGKELPRLTDGELRKQCILLRNWAHVASARVNEVPLSPLDLEEFFNDQNKPDDTWRA